MFDPLRQLQGKEEMNGELLRVWALTAGRYVELNPLWLETVGIGLTLWEGEFEDITALWLRWCDRSGKVIPTGKERADAAEARAKQLAERLQAMGINPDEIA